MQGIFISYRRQDAAGYAGRLHAQLVDHFGEERVFMDVKGLEPGVDFVEEIERAVASCAVLIVIIGRGWLGMDSARKRRLDDPKDFVHIETAAALARHIRVVPVLVDGAVMPREDELPADLAPLSRRQAIELSNKHWDATSGELIRTLERILDGDNAPLSPLIGRGRRRFWAIGAVVATLAAAIGVYVLQPWREPADAVPQEKRAPVAAPPPTVTAPPPTVAVRPPEPTTPAAETRSASPEKAPAPASTENPATPVAPKAAAPSPARPPEKTATPAPGPAPKPAPTPATTPSAAPRSAPSAGSAGSASTPSPPDKAAATEPARPVETPSPNVAAAPAMSSPLTSPAATAAALPPTLPRVGDTWEYRMRSKWPTIPPRTYVHSVSAVSAREVTQAISIGGSADGVAARQTLSPSTRFVEWRGQGLYLLEFNPFLEAFGGLQGTAAITNLPAMPPENPMYGNWTTRGRVRGSESVTVPAGTFDTVKVELDSTRAPIESAGGRSREPVRVILTIWYAPEVKRIAKMLRVVLTPEGSHLDEDTYELVKYRVQ